jgi:tetratricopeptide (TPR) repeat protein
MSTRSSTSFVWPLIAVSVAAAMLSASPLAQSANTAQQTSRRLSRSEHLREWVEAVEHHQPGANDDALEVFNAWRPDDFRYLTIDINTLLALIFDPRLRSFSFQPPGRSAAVRVVYSGSDLRLMLELAKAVRSRGTTEPVTDAVVISPERLAKNRNHVLKRGAIFHTDLVLEGLLGNRSRGRAVPGGLEEFTLLMPDGRSQGVAVDVGHWELARLLLDKVVPAAARDDFVRRWYRATAAYLGGLGQLTPSHFTRAFRLFPDDADLLFFAGCLHEALAEPRVQEAMQGAAIPSDVRFDVSSRRAELRDAESLLRKTLRVQPDHLEARIHLGRVLGLRGEHAEADTLLREAVDQATEPLLQYYAKLFLGTEKEALGDRAQARNLYDGATILYPDAQSPRLALSLLSAVDGRHDDALATMATVLGMPGEVRKDPWWTYHNSQGRNAPDSLAAVYMRFLDEDQR